MKNNELKSGAFLSYLQMGLQCVISLIYTPIMLRTLGDSEYGLYNISTSLISYLSLLNFGFGGAYVRYYTKYKVKNKDEEINKLNGLFLIVFTLFGCLAFVAGLFVCGHLELVFDAGLTPSELAIARIQVFWLSINMALSFPASVFVSFMTANERFTVQKLINMIKTVMTPIAMIAVLAMGYRSITMVVVTTILGIIADLLNVFFCLTKLHMKFRVTELDFRVLKEVAGFSFFIAVNNIIDQINWNVDKILLGRFCGTITAAIYMPAAQLNSLYTQVSTCVSSVFIPRVNQLVFNGDKKRILELFIKVGRIQFMILYLVCSGFYFFGYHFITIWTKPEYSDAYYITLLLIIPATIPLIQNIGIEIQRAYFKHQFRSLVYAAMAVINLFVSIPLCQMYGGIGCALGTAASLVIANGFIMNTYYYKALDLNVIQFWKNIFSLVPSLIPSMITGILMGKFLDYNDIRIYFVSIIVYIGVYCISLWLMGMNKFEKQLFNNIFTQLKKVRK